MWSVHSLGMEVVVPALTHTNLVGVMDGSCLASANALRVPRCCFRERIAESISVKPQNTPARHDMAGSTFCSRMSWQWSSTQITPQARLRATTKEERSLYTQPIPYTCKSGNLLYFH
jgi:hypothetical protein